MRILLLALVVLVGNYTAMGQTIGDFQSHQTGSWSLTATWERWDGGSWITPAPSVPTGTSGVTITIQNTHNVTSNSGAYNLSGTLTVNAGGTLTVGNSITGAAIDFNVASGGHLTNNGTITLASGVAGPPTPNLCQLSIANGGFLENGGSAVTFGNASSRLVFQSGSTYDHIFTTTPGFIPKGASALNVTWSIGSTCKISGYTTNNLPPTNLSTTAFNHFIWDTQNLDLTGVIPINTFDLDGTLKSVSGDLTVTSTGSTGAYLFLTRHTALSLIGVDNFVVNGSVALTGDEAGAPDEADQPDAGVILNCSQSLTVGPTGILFLNANTANSVVDINGNLSNSGFLDFNTSTGITTVNLAGNFGDLVTPGTVGIQGGASSVVNLIFDGATQNLYNSFDFSDDPIVNVLNVTVGNGITATVLNMGANFIESNGNIIVADGSQLNISQGGYLEGAGNFTLSNSSKLGVGSTDTGGAIQTGATNGNIRITGTRAYASTPDESTIEYNGTAAQSIGNGHPIAIGINTIINNSSGVNIGTTVTGITIGGDLTLTSGVLTVGANKTLTTEGAISAGSGSVSLNATASLVLNSTYGTNLSGTFPSSGALSFSKMTLNRPGGNITFPGNVTLSGLLTLTAGDLIYNGQTLTLNGTIAATSGTLSGNSSSTLVIGGTGAFGAIPINTTNTTIGTFTFNRSSGTASVSSSFVISSTFNLQNGTFTNLGGLQMANGSSLIRNAGSLAGNAPFNLPSGQYYNVSYTGSTTTTGRELPTTSDDMLGTLTINGGPVTLNQDIFVNGNVALQNSTFDANGKNIRLSSTSGTWNKTNGSFTGGTGVVTVDNSSHNASYTVTATTTPNFTNITVASGGTNSLTFPGSSINISGNIINNGTISGGSGTINFTGATTISGSSITSLSNINVTGSLIAPASTTLNVGGDFTNNGTFNHNNGSVSFIGITNVLGANASNFFNVSIMGTLTAPSSTTLGIAGNLTNTGTFNHNSGTVAFNGTVAAQTVSGSTLTFNNITVSNPVSPGVSINNTVRLNGVFNLTPAGIFDADGGGTGAVGTGVFIVSSSSQIAGGMINTMNTPANFFGNVTVERYIHGKTGGDYRYLSMPIVTNGNLSLWKSSIFVTGSFSDRSTNADNANISNSGNTNPSVFTYNSATQAYVAVAGATTAGTPLSNTVGYSAYDFNNGPVTASYRGTISKGPINVSISNVNNNFNLVPNPYPAPIDWDNVTKTNVNNAMYIRIDKANVFASYVGGVSTNAPFVGWSGEVATGQAFFVSSNGAGSTLAFKEGDKTTNGFYFLRTKTPENYFRVQVVADNGQYDETVVHFVKNTTDGFDSDYDALKLKNNIGVNPTLSDNEMLLSLSSYLENPGQEFAINSVDELTGMKIVRLNVSDANPGKYSFNFSDFATMSLGYNVILVDTYLNEETVVTDNLSHEFEVNGDISSSGSSRFYLRINGEERVTGVEPELQGVSVYPNPVSDQLQIKLSKDQESSLKSIELYNVMGSSMINSAVDTNLMIPGVKTIDMKSYSSGVYVLYVRYGDIVKSTRIIKK